MTTARTHWHRFAILYGIGFAAAITLVTARLTFNDSDKGFDWPAWTQAVGSIAAILVAVWVSSDQAEQQRRRDDEREEAEIAGVLRSLRAEVANTLAYLQREVEPSLAELANDEPMRSTFSLPEYPFTIFDSLISKLGAIPDADLQTEIIRTYSNAKSLALTIQVHDQMVKELDWAESQQRTNPAADMQAVPRIRDCLIYYGNNLAEAYGDSWDKLQALAASLEAACPDN